MTPWTINSQKAVSIAAHITGTTPTGGVGGKTAALLGYNEQHFQLVSKIHYLLCGQKRKREYTLMKNCPVPAEGAQGAFSY